MRRLTNDAIRVIQLETVRRTLAGLSTIAIARTAEATSRAAETFRQAVLEKQPKE